jgi:hypothetical protein
MSAKRIKLLEGQETLTDIGFKQGFRTAWEDLF